MNHSEKQNRILIADFVHDGETIDKILNLFKSDSAKHNTDIFLASNSSTDYTADYNLVLLIDNDPETIPARISQIKLSLPFSEIILITAIADEKKAELQPASLFDIHSLPLNIRELKRKIDLALTHNGMRRELLRLKESVAMNYGFDNIIGHSSSILKLKETIKRIAATDIAVMISGNHGTGRELAARVLHYHSNRRNKKFTVVDCSTYTEESFLTELFGDGINDGLLRLADRGTLFFKNAERIPRSAQDKLSKFLRDQNLTLDDGTVYKTDIRFISSVNGKIKELIFYRKFSEELYFQLSVLPLELTDLSQRKEDIEEISEYILRRLSPVPGIPKVSVESEVYDAFKEYSWPGNVAELHETLERALKTADDDTIRLKDIVYSSGAKPTKLSEVVTLDERKTKSKKNGLLDEGQRTLILKTLQINNWNFSRTAEDLGIGRTTLWRKVKKYNLREESVV